MKIEIFGAAFFVAVMCGAVMGDCTEPVLICDTPVPETAVPADEACGEDEDGGCFEGREFHQEVFDGDVIYGTVVYNGTTREFDMYEVNIPENVDSAVLNVTVNAAFPVLMAMIEQDEPGSGVCPDVSRGVPVEAVTGPSEACEAITMTSAPLNPGTHWFLLTCDFSSPALSCSGDINCYVMSIETIGIESCDFLPIPKDAVAEGEPCIDSSDDVINGGCNSTPPIFGTIELDVPIVGDAWWDGEIRDSDWYVIDTGGAPIERLSLTLEVIA